MKVAALSGGVGGAKLALGLDRILPKDALTLIANVGDDFTHHGLPVSPDIDTLVYTLSGLADDERGWGLAGETWAFMDALGRLGGAAWFNLGDRDLAMHVLRREALDRGESLSTFTEAVRSRLDIAARILPATDARMPTIVQTVEHGPLAFQRYFVERRAEPTCTGFAFEGAAEARPAPGVLEALQAADVIVLCPSNPFISIDPILAVPGLRDALAAAAAPVVAVSPIVAGEAIKGPTAKMFRELGFAPSPEAYGERYRDFLDAVVVDDADVASVAALEALGLKAEATGTVMRSAEDKVGLAKFVLNFAERVG